MCWSFSTFARTKSSLCSKGNREVDKLVMEEKLKEYKTFLEKLCQSKSSEVFTNGGIDHAAILMSTLFRNTEQSIKMLCAGLKPALITKEPYLSDFTKFLSTPGKSIQIIVGTDEFINETPFQLIIEKLGEPQDHRAQIECRIMDDKGKKQVMDFFGSECHFSIFDTQKYRLEVNPEKYQAIGSFNAPDYTKRLTDLFDSIFKSSQLIPALAAENLG